MSSGPAAGRTDSGDGDRIDAGGYVARSRRRADLSQRELAERLGVGRATVARWETGEVAMRVDDLADALACAGLRLQVVTAQGEPVPPFDRDTVRDNAERRFPAHLDVAPPDQRPSNRGLGERYDRPPPRGWYALRRTRDHGQGTDAATARPADHPTKDELAVRTGELRAQRALRIQQWAGASKPQPPCTCLDGCFEVAGCLRECRCRCEPLARDQIGSQLAATS